MTADGQEYWGLARVNLSDLKYDHPAAQGHRPVAARNVARLVQIFRLEGCDRLQVDQHCIDGVVDRNVLYNDTSSNIEPRARRLPADVNDIPILRTTVRCLNGLHRKLAAEEYLDDNDQWWTVRIFIDDRPQQNCIDAVEEYANELCYNDGEIFRKIREYNIAKNQELENRWWARLTETKRKDLRQLLKNEKYSDAFDALLPWHGLWYPIKLGSLHRLLTMKCDEEMINYLQHIADIWARIASTTQSAVDMGTVKALEGLAPAFSHSDSASVNRAMALKTLFPTIDSEDVRRDLLGNILAVPTLIPSFLTFFESLKYLEPCAKVMRSLLPPRNRRTIRQCLWGSYFQPLQSIVECPTGIMRSPIPSQVSLSRSAGYLQLWLFALRHFPELTNCTPRKDSDQEKPLATEPNPMLWQQFGELACALGFATTAAKNLRSSDAPRQLATRISEQCGLEEDVRDQLIVIFGGVRAVGSTSEPFLVGPATLPFARRFGRPFQADHMHDKKFLYLSCMHTEDPSTGFDITSFFCKRDLISHFFGIPNISIGADFVADSPSPFAAHVPGKATSTHCVNCSTSRTQYAGEETGGGELHELATLREANARFQDQLQDLEARLRTADMVKQLAEHQLREHSAMCAQHQCNENELAESAATIAELQQQLRATTRQLEIVNGNLTDVAGQVQNVQQQNELLEDARYAAEVATQNQAHEQQLEIAGLRNHNNDLLQLCQEMEQSRRAIDAARTEAMQFVVLKVYRPDPNRPTYIERVWTASQAQSIIAEHRLLDRYRINHYIYRLQRRGPGDPLLVQKQDLMRWAENGSEVLAARWQEYGTLVIYDPGDSDAAMAQLRTDNKASAREAPSRRKTIGAKRRRMSIEPYPKVKPKKPKAPPWSDRAARSLPRAKSPLLLEASTGEHEATEPGSALMVYNAQASPARRTEDSLAVDPRTAEGIRFDDDDD